MTVRVVHQKSATDTAESFRLAAQVAMGLGASGVLDRRSGIVPSPGAAALSNVSAMTGRVAPFIAWVDGTSGGTQGGYPVIVDVPEDITFDPGEPGNPRLDRIVAQVRDNPYDSSGAQDGRVRIVKGQAGGAGNSVPASSIHMYDTTVPTGASAGGGGFDIAGTSVARFPFVSALGGLLLVRDQTERDALTPYNGMRVYRLDVHDTQIYRNGAWVWDGPPLTGRKLTDQNIVGVGFTNVAGLSVDLAPNAVYDVSSLVIYATPDATDIAIDFTVPAGAFINWAAFGVPTSVTISDGILRMGNTTGGSRSLGGGGGGGMIATPTGTVITTGTAGTLQMRAAQIVASGTTTVFTSSLLMARRIG